MESLRWTAIVAKILEEHGGGIELQDNPAGRGGLVRMWIAANKSDEAAEPAELAAAQHHGEAEAIEVADTPQLGSPVDDAAGDDDFADQHGSAVQAPRHHR